MIQETLIGRKEEKEILQKAYNSMRPEMVAVIGRRRVGKTFLIRSVFENRIKFEVTGIKDAKKEEQLENFAIQLNEFARPTLPVKNPSSWLEAFALLRSYLETQLGSEKIVVFLDELPWLATHKSGFIKALGSFWNSWASKKNVLLVICGSAASWMIKKIVKDKGGLHNRITRRITLKSFNLAETEVYLKSNHVNMERYQILQIYMAMGGIPHYLKEVEAGKSAVQNIDQICFSENGLLNDEFSLLYPALFEDPERHIKIIHLLASKRKGLTRKEIIAFGNLSDGGNTSKAIDELSTSGFITAYYTFGKKKREMRYRLTDEYSLFYLKFIDKNRNEGKGTWKKLSQTQTWKSWSGYAFENIGLKHTQQIKKALEIGGIYTEASTYISKGNEDLPGIEIDLLIDRNDQAINLCEFKFYKEEFILTKAYAEELRRKKAVFKAMTGTKKQLFLTLISTFPSIPNQHSIGLVDNALSMEVLFEG
ncbi:MAG: ATP-binding protein [Bacteroidia bacterium]